MDEFQQSPGAGTQTARIATKCLIATSRHVVGDVPNTRHYVDTQPSRHNPRKQGLVCALTFTVAPHARDSTVSSLSMVWNARAAAHGTGDACSAGAGDVGAAVTGPAANAAAGSSDTDGGARTTLAGAALRTATSAAIA